MENLHRILEGHPLFEEMDHDHLEFLVDCGMNTRMERGSYAFHEGEPADHFWLIREGTVALELHIPDGPPMLVDTLHAGDVLGWSWLFPPFRWHHDARVVEATRAIVIDGACLRRKCDQDPALGYDLMRRFARIVINRLQATQLQLLDVYGHATRV